MRPKALLYSEYQMQGVLGQNLCTKASLEFCRGSSQLVNIQFRVSLRLPIICPEREQGRHGRQGEKREHRLVFTYFQYFSTGTFLKCYSPKRNNTDQWKHNFNLRLNQCSMKKSFKYRAVIKQSQIKKIKSFAGNHPHHKLPNCSLSPTPDFSSHSCYPIRTHEV